MHIRDPVRRWLPDLILLFGMAAVTWLVADAYVHGGMYVWGDNPGQFMRLWYPLTVSLPEYGRLIDWNPFWYAGYPELQFYPPGFVIVGLVLRTLTLGRLSPEHLYDLLVAIALVLPLFTCFAFLRIALTKLGEWPSRLAGVSAGLMALAFPVQWGGTNAVAIGMIGERLAFGVVPLVLLAGWKLVERPNAGRLVAASALLAVLVVLHPFHAPASVCAVGFYAAGHTLAGRSEPRKRNREIVRWSWLVAWVLLALALTAWWLVPLVVRRMYAAPLVRASLSETMSWLRARPMRQLLPGLLPALFLLRYPARRVRATVGALALLVPTVVFGIILIDRALFQIFDIKYLDPVRFAAELYLAAIFLTAAGLGMLVTSYLWRRWLIGITVAAFLLFNVAIAAWKLWPEFVAKTAVPAEARLPVVLTHPAFDGLWEALRRGPHSEGRLLFTSYYLQLSWPGGTSTPTALKAMTPYFTGREIIGGTFSHWSPVARLLWAGDPWIEVLPARVEREDDLTFLGQSWRTLDDETLYDFARALNVTTIVADADDMNARRMLDTAPHFESYWNNGHFFLYRVVDASPAWITAEGAEARLVARSSHRWMIVVDRASEDAILKVKLAFYPLWHASVDGRPIPVRAGRRALTEVVLPPGGPYTVILRYRTGWPERAGWAITGLGFLTILVVYGKRTVRQTERWRSNSASGGT